MDLWIEKAQLYVEPIAGDSPVGEDPRYSDEFSLLKAEVEKKSDVNFERIRELSENILKTSAKDLRVGSYLTMALARLDGMVGLGQGMAILHELVKVFGDELMPVKQKARLSAIRWIQQDKILAFAQGSTKNLSQAEAEAAVQTYDSLFESFSALSGEPLSWPDLQKWLKAEHSKLTPSEKSAPTGDRAASNVSNSIPPSSPVAAVQAVSGSSGITSTAQYIQIQRSLMAYFREQKQYAKLFGIACSCQWGGLKLPPNEGGKTRLPAPRESSLNRVRNALDNEQWEEGLLASLDAFMEPGGQYSLEIAKYAYDCARQAGEKETAEHIQLQISALSKRIPKLLQLKFENEDPFASTNVTAWLDQINERNEQQNNGVNTGYKIMLQKAREIISESDIHAAFEFLSNSPVKSELAKVELEYCKAQICVEQNRSDIALPILLCLQEDVERLKLAGVSPEIAMLIWRQLYRLQKDRLAAVEQDEGRVEMENHLAHLKSLMCTTDVASAMQWL